MEEKLLLQSIGELKNLKYLMLRNNQLTMLPQSLAKLKNLQFLDLRASANLDFKEAFKIILQIKSIEILDLSENNLSSLPDNFGELENLSQLNLSNNQLVSLPESFGNLKKLLELQITQNLLKSLPENVYGPVLELGSGGGFLERYIPGLIKSEIQITPGVDIVLDGRLIPFRRDSLRGIVMLDVLHHLRNASDFFKEAAHCIKKSGVIVMIEPWTTTWSRFVYRKFHHEPFDMNTDRWDFPQGGPLSQANSALPWIIFHRDKAVFQKEFPEWNIKEIKLHTPFAYLLSGGVSLRSLVPGFSFPVCRLFEYFLRPVMKSLAMFATIILDRRDS